MQTLVYGMRSMKMTRHFFWENVQDVSCQMQEFGIENKDLSSDAVGKMGPNMEPWYSGWQVGHGNHDSRIF